MSLLKSRGDFLAFGCGGADAPTTAAGTAALLYF
jgi:hypothetical protein